MAETHIILQKILQTDWKHKISTDITLNVMNSWLFGFFFQEDMSCGWYEHIFIEGNCIYRFESFPVE